MRSLDGTILMAAILAAASADGIRIPAMPESVRPIVPKQSQIGRGFLTCVDCGQGGGTLLNTERGGAKAKVHKKGHCRA